MQKKLLDQHTTDTAVVGCIDFRFREHFPKAIADTFGITEFDDIRLAGAAGNLVLFGDERRDILLADLELAVSAHKVQRIVLLGHQACGKYGSCGHTFTEPTAEEAFHADTLKKAQMLLKEKFPSVEVLLGFTAVADDDTVVIRKVS